MTIAGAGPLYAQVRNILIERIHHGDWKPGEPIPSEIRLARALDVSQGTIRKAISDLVADNVLVRQQGKGTFVATHDSRRALFQFFHIVSDLGERALPESRTLFNRLREANRDEALALDVAVGEPVVRIERLRSLGRHVVLAETISVVAERFAGLHELPPEDVPNTLYELYERRYGITIHRAEEKLKAVNASARIARLLALDAGDAVLRIDRTAYTLAGKAVEYRASFCNSRHHHYASVQT
jgi:GntR family transcriptional regulator